MGHLAGQDRQPSGEGRSTEGHRSQHASCRPTNRYRPPEGDPGEEDGHYHYQEERPVVGEQQSRRHCGHTAQPAELTPPPRGDQDQMSGQKQDQ